MHRFQFLIVVLVWANGVWASFDKAAMCSGAKLCLHLDLPTCNTTEKKPNPDIKYNSEFCAPFLELKGRGLSLQSSKALEIYSYLGREYRIIYQVKGELPVNENMMRYLFDHMDFTAHLINAYQKTNYTIMYQTTDRRKFLGNNGGNLSGRFHWTLQDSAGQHKGLRNTFFGFGRTKVMMWKLHGVAVVFLDLYPVDNKTTRYDLRSVVFPANGFLNGIMKMDLFRNVVNDKIREIIENIEKASTTYAKGDLKPIEKYKVFSHPRWATQLQEFNAVVNGSGYTLGQSGKAYVPPPPPSKAKGPKTRQ